MKRPRLGVTTPKAAEPAGLSSPDSARGKLQRICLELLREHEQQGQDGLPTNNRFLGYELIQRGILSKQKTGARRTDQNLHEALTHLRQAGIVPWDWITDETRSLSDHTGWSSINDWATTMVDHIRLDPWHGRAPLTLTESRSLSGVLDNLASRYAVKLAATNGQVGGFLHTDIAPQLSPGDRVLYCGDWDWQGHQIEHNTRRVLEQIIGGELDWKRIALTEEQVDRYDLRRAIIRKADRRYKPVRYHDAIETEALKQNVIVGIVRDALDAELPETLSTVLEREARQRAAMRPLAATGMKIATQGEPTYDRQQTRRTNSRKHATGACDGPVRNREPGAA